MNGESVRYDLQANSGVSATCHRCKKEGTSIAKDLAAGDGRLKSTGWNSDMANNHDSQRRCKGDRNQVVVSNSKLWWLLMMSIAVSMGRTGT